MNKKEELKKVNKDYDNSVDDSILWKDILYWLITKKGVIHEHELKSTGKNNEGFYIKGIYFNKFWTREEVKEKVKVLEDLGFLKYVFYDKDPDFYYYALTIEGVKAGLELEEFKNDLDHKKNIERLTTIIAFVGILNFAAIIVYNAFILKNIVYSVFSIIFLIGFSIFLKNLIKQT